MWGKTNFHLLPHLKLLFIFLLLKNSLKLLFDVCGCFVGMSVYMPPKYVVPLESFGPPVTEVADGCELHVGAACLDSGPLEEQPLLFAAEPPLQPSKVLK